MGGIRFKRTLKGAPKKLKQHEVIFISDDDDEDNQIECDTNTNDSNEITSSSTSSSSGCSSSNSNKNKCNSGEEDDINAYLEAHSASGICDNNKDNCSNPIKSQARQRNARNCPPSLPRRRSLRGTTSKPALFYKETKPNYRTYRKLFKEYVDKMRQESERQCLSRFRNEEFFTD